MTKKRPEFGIAGIDRLVGADRLRVEEGSLALPEIFSYGDCCSPGFDLTIEPPLQ